MAANEPFAGGVDLKMAGNFAAAGSVLDVGEFAAVGAVDKVAVGMDFDLGGSAVFEVAGEGGDGLDFG